MNGTTAKTYQCGTLKFNLFQIWSLFFWMLWGAVGMNILGASFNSATPFLFRNHGLSDTFIAVIMGTVFSWMNTVINPILSTVSDNWRSKLGRRIPFILYTALPAALLMAALPFYPYLCKILPEMIAGISTKALLLGFGAIIYYFFYLFVAILYYYLIPDVVPASLMGRFYGFFRVVTVLAGIVFSKFVFPYIASHPQIVYPATGAFYLVAALLLCFFVREGQYPEVAKKPASQPLFKRIGGSLGEYCKECFGKKYYWWFYVAGLVIGLSGCINIFLNFFYLDSCNMTMQDIGDLGVYIGIVSAVSCFVAGFLVDKIGAFASTFIAQLVMGLCYIGIGLFVYDSTALLIWRIPLAIAGGINAVAGGRILVEVFPRSKFGMIASGRNLLVSLFVGLVNYPVGLFSDFLKNAKPDTTLMLGGIDLMPMLRGYRFINFWAGFFYLLGMVILLYFYFALHRKRTDKAYEM